MRRSMAHARLAISARATSTDSIGGSFQIVRNRHEADRRMRSGCTKFLGECRGYAVVIRKDKNELEERIGLRKDRTDCPLNARRGPTHGEKYRTDAVSA